MDELKNVIELQKIHILGVTETWLDDRIGDGEVTLPDYRIFRRDRSGKVGGGVCVYVHHSLSVSSSNWASELYIEMLCLSLTLGKSLHKIGYLYRPPNAPVQFWSELDAALEGLEGSNISLLGDLNVDLLKPSDLNYFHLKSIGLPLQVENILHSSTRYLKCLDPILTNSVRVQSPSSTVVHFSDHALVDAMLTAPSKCNMQGEPNLSFKRNWSADSINQFERALQRNMSSLSASGIESMWEEWRSKFTSALTEAVPLSVLKRTKKRKCPWMTRQLLHLLQKQKAMYQRVIRSGRRETVAVQQHRAMRNQYNNLYRQNKNMYFQEHLAEYRYAPRPLWKAINHIAGRTAIHSPPMKRFQKNCCGLRCWPLGIWVEWGSGCRASRSPLFTKSSFVVGYACCRWRLFGDTCTAYVFLDNTWEAWRFPWLYQVEK